MAPLAPAKEFARVDRSGLLKKTRSLMVDDAGNLHAYLDTNALVEFRSFAENDWLGLVGEKSVVLVVAHSVLQELQRLKDGGNSGNVPRKKRQRAAALLDTLEELIFPDASSPGGPHAVRAGVTLMYDRSPPSDEIFTRHALDVRQGDGRFVATIVAARERGERACVVTDDAGARWLAKGLGVAAFDMPETWRLKDDPDPAEAENRELKKRLATAETRTPRLSLAFTGLETFVAKVLPKPRLPVTEHASEHLDALRMNYDFERSAFAFHTAFGVASGERERYRKDVAAFIEKAGPLIPEIITRRNLLDLYVEVSELQLVVDGTAPGEKVEVVVRAPPGITIATGLPKEEPRLPAAPRPPRADYELLAATMDSFAMPRVFRPAVARFTEPASPFELSGDGQTLRISMGTVRHGKALPVPTFYFVQQSYEAAGPFGFDFEIHAHNLPEKVTGRLHVRLTLGTRMSKLRLERRGEDHDNRGYDDE